MSDWVIVDRLLPWQVSPLAIRRYSSEGAARAKLKELSRYYVEGTTGITTEARVIEIPEGRSVAGMLADINAADEPRAVECLADIGKPGHKRG